VAERLRSSFAAEVPDFRAQRAAFTQSVGERRTGFGWLRFFGPVTVTAVALVVAIMMGRTALPGQTFYPVRQALRAVGLAPFSLAEVDQEISRARGLLAQAETLNDSDPDEARAVAFEAVKVLGFAEQLLPEVAADRAQERVAAVKGLLLRAQGLLLHDDETRPERSDHRAEPREGGDDQNGNGDSHRAGGGGAQHRDEGDRSGRRDEHGDARDDRANKDNKDRDEGADRRAENEGPGDGAEDRGDHDTLEGDTKEDVSDDEEKARKDEADDDSDADASDEDESSKPGDDESPDTLEQVKNNVDRRDLPHGSKGEDGGENDPDQEEDGHSGGADD
jgi:hypothetical protein